MRQIILDTETTGLEPSKGHRIIEIGCVEVVNRRVTGQTYHQYINPEREVDQGAYDVHGISNEFLTDKPVFKDIVEAFMAFVQDAELVIHNAPFDVGFINHELQLLKQDWKPISEYCSILDTLVMARKRHPGQKNNLDALCKRYYIDNSQRELHGALLDSRILADVYLAMSGGQTSLLPTTEHTDEAKHDVDIQPLQLEPGSLPIIQANDEEIAAHQAILSLLDKAAGESCMWNRISASAAELE